MKSMDIFCVSPASTAICTNINHRTVDPSTPFFRRTKIDAPRRSNSAEATGRRSSSRNSSSQKKSSGEIVSYQRLKSDGVCKPATAEPNLNSRKTSSTVASAEEHQVVELRVSIHCKGCEGKLRKHISKMPGVTSFSIDLATKKVIIIGDVTPSWVLTTISKVKNAQLWGSPLLITS